MGVFRCPRMEPEVIRFRGQGLQGFLVPTRPADQVAPQGGKLLGRSKAVYKLHFKGLRVLVFTVGFRFEGFGNQRLGELYVGVLITREGFRGMKLGLKVYSDPE